MVGSGVLVAVGEAVGVSVGVGVSTKRGTGAGTVAVGNPMVGEGQTNPTLGGDVALGGVPRPIVKRPDTDAPSNPTIPTKHIRETHPAVQNASLRVLCDPVWLVGAARGSAAHEEDVWFTFHPCPAIMHVPSAAVHAEHP